MDHVRWDMNRRLAGYEHDAAPILTQHSGQIKSGKPGAAEQI